MTIQILSPSIGRSLKVPSQLSGSSNRFQEGKYWRSRKGNNMEEKIERNIQNGRIWVWYGCPTRKPYQTKRPRPFAFKRKDLYARRNQETDIKKMKWPVPSHASRLSLGRYCKWRVVPMDRTTWNSHWKHELHHITINEHTNCGSSFDMWSEIVEVVQQKGGPGLVGELGYPTPTISSPRAIREGWNYSHLL